REAQRRCLFQGQLMLLLLDIGNTHTHLGLAGKKVVRQTEFPTKHWFDGKAAALIKSFCGKRPITGAALCSVVPKATAPAARLLKSFGAPWVELNARNIQGVGIDYPKPASIGPDRLANAIAARKHFGAPAVVVDFGTAVTFDVVNPAGNYVGGIIAPGLAAMTDYLHEKTALLPKIEIRETKSVIGKSTTEAMLIGAVHGYRGLIRELIHQLRGDLGVEDLPVVATGGYAKLMARGLPMINAVMPELTLEGLRILWEETFEKG
ncbi:MAG TPA: type III pantothenate kinase, partial [Verrucomicrobiae bacterium]|nr:type III pantothenate kinase [Verrucomicrobiae bacterium]